MKLKFLLDKEYIFLHAINQSQPKEPFKGWGDFTLKIWDKHPQECYFLAGFAEWPLLSKKSIKDIASNSQKLLKEWLKQPSSKRLFEETRQYKDWLKKEWNRKSKKALKELSNIIKISFPEKEIIVYVTHPKLNNGICISSDIICWGHEEKWQNYSIVYLCHEILHAIFWGDNSETTHSVIELATDNELRIRLQGKGRYFETETHKELLKKEKSLFQAWKNYLKSKKDIKEFIQEQNK